MWPVRQQTLRLKPTFEIPIIHIGNLYFQLGRYREALQQFQKYVEVAPFDEDRTRGYISMAWVAQAFERIGDAARARASYERFVQVWRDADPDVPELASARARLAATTH